MITTFGIDSRVLTRRTTPKKTSRILSDGVTIQTWANVMKAKTIDQMIDSGTPRTAAMNEYNHVFKNVNVANDTFHGPSSPWDASGSAITSPYANCKKKKTGIN